MDNVIKELWDEQGMLPSKCIGWIIFYNKQRYEITKTEASSLYDAKLKFIQKLNVPKSKQSLIAIEPGYDPEP